MIAVDALPDVAGHGGGWGLQLGAWNSRICSLSQGSGVHMLGRPRWHESRIFLGPATIELCKTETGYSNACDCLGSAGRQICGLVGPQIRFKQRQLDQHRQKCHHPIASCRQACALRSASPLPCLARQRHDITSRPSCTFGILGSVGEG